MSIDKKKKETEMGCSMGKKLLVAVSLFFAAIAQTFAGSLSFQILQKNESLSEVCESALVIEDEILNYFFEHGFIVSNVAAAVSDTDAQDEKYFKDSYNEAVEGAVDNFCLIKLYFTGGAEENQRVSVGTIKKIGWKLVSLKNGEVLEDSSRAVKQDITYDEEANVREFAADFASYLHKLIKQKA